MRNHAVGRAIAYSPSPSGSYPDVAVDVIRSGDTDWAANFGTMLTFGHDIEQESWTQGYLGWLSTQDITSTLDLGSALSGQVFLAQGIWGDEAIHRPVQVKLEHSDNGSSWTSFLDKTSLADGGQPGLRQWYVEFDISSAGSHRYWRLTIDCHTTNWVFVGGIEFWG